MTRSALERLGERRPLAAVIFVAALLFLPWLEAGPLKGSLEANRLVAARELYYGGDWVVPTLNGELYLLKPPFQYWCMELSFLLTGGPSLWAGRLVSALAVIFTGLLVTSWGRRELGPRVGYLGGVLLVTSGLVLEKGVVAELETVLVATSTATLLFAWRGIRSAGSRWSGSRWSGAAGLFLGASVMTKGPVVFLVLVPALLALAAAQRDLRPRVVAQGLVIAAAGALTVLPWVLALIDRVGWETVSAVYRHEVFARVNQPGESNQAPAWFYLPALAVGLLPGSLLLPRAARALRAIAGQDAESRAKLAFLAAWAIAPPVLLSFSEGKEARYLIGCFPAWALLLAWGAAGEPGARSSGVLARGGARLLGALGWLLPPTLAAAGYGLAPDARPWLFVACGLFLAARILAWRRGAGPGHGEGRRSGLAVATLALALLGVKVVWAKVYLAERSIRVPTQRMGAEVATHLGENEPLLVKKYDAALHFAVDRPLVYPEELAATPRPERPRFALDYDGDAALAELGPWEPIDSWQVRETRYRLLRATDR